MFGNHSLPSLLSSAMWRGLTQSPAELRSIVQRSVSSLGAAPGDTGRFETKYMRFSSLVNERSASLYWPENGATSGSDQRLFRHCEIITVQCAKFGVLRRK